MPVTVNMHQISNYSLQNMVRANVAGSWRQHAGHREGNCGERGEHKVCTEHLLLY